MNKEIQAVVWVFFAFGLIVLGLFFDKNSIYGTLGAICLMYAYDTKNEIWLQNLQDAIKETYDRLENIERKEG